MEVVCKQLSIFQVVTPYSLKAPNSLNIEGDPN